MLKRSKFGCLGNFHINIYIYIKKHKDINILTSVEHWGSQTGNNKGSTIKFQVVGQFGDCDPNVTGVTMVKRV